MDVELDVSKIIFRRCHFQKKRFSFWNSPLVLVTWKCIHGICRFENVLLTQVDLKMFFRRLSLWKCFCAWVFQNDLLVVVALKLSSSVVPLKFFWCFLIWNVFWLLSVCKAFFSPVTLIMDVENWRFENSFSALGSFWK